MKKNENLYDIIKEARLKIGISQRELALITGIHHSVIARIEKGEIIQPSINVLIKMAKTLNLDLADMLVFYGYGYDELEEIGVYRKNNK